VSGGRDSVALLHFLSNQKISQSWIIVHVNHQLRGHESEEDARFVQSLAAAYQLPCEVVTVDVRTHAQEQQISIETAARQLRYQSFFQMAEKHDAPAVYLAHHADDQAETVLANLCRGTALQGLCGMAAESTIHADGQSLTLLRPMLSWRRSEIDRYIQQHDLCFREDASNTDPSHRRNRLRHEALPLLKDIFAREVTVMIQRLSHLAVRDEEALQSLAKPLYEHCVQADGRLQLSPALRSAPTAIQSRVIHRWLGEWHQIPDLSADLLESALQLLAQITPAKINLPAGRHLRRKAGYLWVEENKKF
jgi:tRNA(Ile)-lysidine synthase